MKQIIISIILLLTVVSASAQTNQYPGTSGSISKSGYTYKYRNEIFAGRETASGIELYNAANPYFNVERGYKDGTQMSFDKAMGHDDVLEFSASSQTVRQTLTMVDGLFTAQQKAALKGNMMSVQVRFEPSTGKIADVYFVFFRNSPFMNIPVETYRSIELALKQKLTVTVTNEGRRMNYIELNWSQKF